MVVFYYQLISLLFLQVRNIPEKIILFWLLAFRAQSKTAVQVREPFFLLKLPQLRNNHLPLEILYLRAYPRGGSLGCTTDWLSGGRGFLCPATFFHGDWSWNIFYGHSLSSADFRFRRTIVSFWRQKCAQVLVRGFYCTYGANSSPV